MGIVWLLRANCADFVYLILTIIIIKIIIIDKKIRIIWVFHGSGKLRNSAIGKGLGYQHDYIFIDNDKSEKY